MSGLTQKQRDCLEAIERLTVDGVAPDYEELRRDLGQASKSGVHRLITSLVERGYVSKLDGRARSLSVVRPAQNLEDMDSKALRSLVSRARAILFSREYPFGSNTHV